MAKRRIDITPRARLADWIIVALGEGGGTADRADLLTTMDGLFGHTLTSSDRSFDRTPKEPTWHNESSHARKDLVRDGKLKTTADSGFGTWALTEHGWSRYGVLLDVYRDQIGAGTTPLCPTFRRLAGEVSDRVTRGRSASLAPGETTLTDNVLLDLALAHPVQIAIERFTWVKESVNGADWEWWFRDRHGYAGFRVQAKTAHATTGTFSLRQRAPKSASRKWQVELFWDKCRADRIAGLYCLYSDLMPRDVGVSDLAGPCPHGLRDTRQWGVSLLGVDAAKRHAVAGTKSAAEVLSDAMPWYRLVCPGPGRYTNGSLTGAVRGFLRTIAEAEIAVGQDGIQHERDIDQVIFDVAVPLDVRVYFETRRRIRQSRGLAGIVLVDAVD